VRAIRQQLAQPKIAGAVIEFGTALRSFALTASTDPDSNGYCTAPFL
jgi:hypothetical protein